MPNQLVNGVNSCFARWLPEKRIFLRSENATRYIHLSPLKQLTGIAGIAAVMGWTLVASSVLMIDAISSRSPGDRSEQVQATFEERLDKLSAERDARASEAVAAQQRFAVAMQQVSEMQSQLLASEKNRQELATGLTVVQSNLHDMMLERNKTEIQVADGDAAQPRDEELSIAVSLLSGELRNTVSARTEAQQLAETARLEAEDLRIERDQIIAESDEILSDLEDAVTVSVKPLDQVFRAVGMDPDEVLETIRDGYSGQGGPLNPIAYSTSGEAAISNRQTKAKQIIVTLDQMNTYRIALEKLPLAMPVKSSFRYTSGFGRRWGRMHEGVDMAGPTGTPVYATGDGVITFAGRQSGYGNLIKVKHELGTETRYAHLSRIRVKVGQRVSQGEQIGDMGNTGRSTGPHLHYEVRMKGRAVDPMRFIKAAKNVF